LSVARRVTEGFDYPVGQEDSGRKLATEENDGDGYYNAQDFGNNNHLGEDWNGEKLGNSDWGDPVYAIAHGTIISAQPEGPEWGNVVIIRHFLSDGTEIDSLYGHLDSILIFEGEVSRGDQIGTI